MIARIHGCGRGTRGLVAYVTHDQTSPQNPPPSTAAGVGFAESVNFPQCAPQLAGLIMARTAADAEFLKREAGISTKGRKLKRPFAHFSLRLGALVWSRITRRIASGSKWTSLAHAAVRHASATSDNGGSADNPSSSCAEETCQSIPATTARTVSN